jgi:hypothetical protein
LPWAVEGIPIRICIFIFRKFNQHFEMLDYLWSGPVTTSPTRLIFFFLFYHKFINSIWIFEVVNSFIFIIWGIRIWKAIIAVSEFFIFLYPEGSYQTILYPDHVSIRTPIITAWGSFSQIFFYLDFPNFSTQIKWLFLIEPRLNKNLFKLEASICSI